MDKEWPDEDYFDDEEKSEFDEWRETDNARRYREYEQERRAFMHGQCDFDVNNPYIQLISAGLL
jgi:hypothetical protein